MCYSPSVQASMELEERFIKAVARREIPRGVPFRIKVEKGDEGALQMFCVDASGAVIEALGTVVFWPNITDAMSMA